MKKSIKLKHGKSLQRLLKHPEELAMLVKVAFNSDEETGIAIFKATARNIKAIDSLIFWKLIKVNGEGWVLTDKSVVDVTIRRKPKGKEELEKTKMQDLKMEDVPEEFRPYFEIAESFRVLFFDNLVAIGGRTINIEKATYGGWVDTVRLMTTEDKVTLEEFREVWKFLRGHKFWSDKVQSMKKLRDKFETIYSQIKGNDKRKKTKSDSQKGNVSTEYAQRVLKDLQSD